MKSTSFETNNIKSVALYHFAACPYCARTRKATNNLGLQIEKRDIRLDSQHRQDLLNGGGKGQVPCLKIESKSGQVEWLYESENIIRYLHHNVNEIKAVLTGIANEQDHQAA
ncbi:MAG: glutathione S-transferase N-terminal domain-containing protein [Pseudomonadales bacterium]|nr:glutathione S-transferase N-terminal domain-containing protein [Pseudomonadales bacterium]